jgi:hypothetical protein
MARDHFAQLKKLKGKGQVINGEKKLVVSGAGDARVNGVYVPISKLPAGGANVGPLIWRHETTDWIHIVNGEGCWWIGHYANCTEDLYFSGNADYEENEKGNPPVGIQFSPCENGGPWFKGTHPAPSIDWAPEE